MAAGSSMRVLALTGSEDLARSVKLSLSTRWPSTSVATSASVCQILEWLRCNRFELIVCDYELFSEGVWCSILQSMRNEARFTPILVLGAEHAEVNHRIEVLNHGADQWIGCNVLETQFIARVESLIRRLRPPVRRSLLRDSPLEFDLDNRSIAGPNGRVSLSGMETSILQSLLENANQYVSSVELYKDGWGSDVGGGPARVRVAVHRLRRKLLEAGGPPSMIENVRGLGYKIGQADKPS